MKPNPAQKNDQSDKRRVDTKAGSDKSYYLPRWYLPTWIPLWLFKAIGPISLVIFVAAGLSGYYAYYYITKDSVRMHEWVGFMLSFIGLVVICTQVAIYAQQAEFMKRQAEILDRQREASDTIATTTLRQFEITDRPWMKFEARFTQPITFTDEGGMSTELLVSAKNVGKSVAVNTTINAVLIAPILGVGHNLWAEVLRKQEEICSKVSSDIMTYVVFPDDDYTYLHGTILGKGDIERGRLKDTDIISFYLVGCVDYQFAGHKAHHQTRFAYEIVRRKPGALGTFGFRIGQDAPVDELVLRKMFMGGDYAD